MMHGSLGENIVLMSENNNEALHILKRVMVDQPNSLLGLILDLDDMQMRGIQIVAAFKYCKEDIATLVNAGMERDLAMIAYVNKEVPTLRAYPNGAAREASFSRGARIRR